VRLSKSSRSQKIDLPQLQGDRLPSSRDHTRSTRVRLALISLKMHHWRDVDEAAHG
jgi:hypothetical protein